jgi:hypothetical protein
MKSVWLQTRFPLICFAFTLLFLWLGDVVDSRFGNFALPVTIAFWTISAIPLAVSFYRMRRKSRLAYGLIEFLVACGLLYSTMLAIVHHGPGVMTIETLTARSLTFFAMIYFMVRALDNIGEGLGSDWPIAKRWNATFPKS